MTYLGKLLRKFTISFLAATFSLFLINGLVYGLYINFLTSSHNQNKVQTVLETVSETLSQSAPKTFRLSTDSQKLLEANNIWAMLLDNQNGSVLWQSQLPDHFPLRYSSTDIAKFSRGYLLDYPVFVWEHANGLLVLGYPKSSYTKQLSNYQTIASIKAAPFFLVLILLIDFLLLFLLYYRAELRTIRLLQPFIESISQLAQGNAINLQATTPLTGLAEEINQVSRQLQKKDSARANWISGISHDIRTPLSIILGYSDKLSRHSDLPVNVQRKAAQIAYQALKIKNLVTDLNLASKLEYNMQPLNKESIAIAPFLRQITVDFLNFDLDDKYDIDCHIESIPAHSSLLADSSLIYRAMENLINNSILHNPKGCQILLSATLQKDNFEICVADNGVGISADILHKLENQPHSIMSDAGASQQRHGLGLLIVKQIMAAHQGSLLLRQNPNGGLIACLRFPICYLS
ncbi:sensor histidine kinase [Clostridiales bacterium COT073_COT-073]|nr:sensor histidine kinase [Clostridiales bacterium COT073_COT-073]